MIPVRHLLLTPPALAARYGLSQTQLERDVRRGALPPPTHNGHVRAAPDRSKERLYFWVVDFKKPKIKKRRR
jgi:hypothetical protein